MLAAGLLGLLSRQRRHWLRRRPLDAPLGAVDPDAAELERWLRSMNEQDLRQRRDRVLRALSDHLAHHGVRPVVRAMELGDEVTLRVDDDAPPPPGITASSGARRWALPPEFDVAGVPDDAEPYLVALVSCGVLPSGALLQLNLMAADAVGIVGDDAVVDDVMTSWATELATAGASDDVEVIVVDPPHPLVERIDRIAIAADIADAVARVRWLTEDAAGRCVVLVGRQGHGTTEVAALLEAAGHPHVGAVLSGEVPAGVTVEIDAAQQVHVSTEEVTLSAPRWLTPDDWDRFGDLLRGAGPAGLGDPVPSPLQPVAAPEPEPVGSLADRSVGVLGALTIDGTPSQLDPVAAGLLTYLVLHPTGASPAALDELLWPRRAADHGRLSRAVAAVEAAFGENRPVIVHTDDGRFEAHDDVACDLVRCEELARGLGRLDPTTRARRRYLALELVRGAPFADGIAWAHADGTALRATGLIVDLAHRLAAHALTIGDVERAAWAVDRGLRAAPTNELLHRDRMRVADARGDAAALDAAMDAVRQLAAADGGRALSATERCYRELRAAAIPYARATEDAG